MSFYSKTNLRFRTNKQLKTTCEFHFSSCSWEEIFNALNKLEKNQTSTSRTTTDWVTSAVFMKSYQKLYQKQRLKGGESRKEKLSHGKNHVWSCILCTRKICNKTSTCCSRSSFSGWNPSILLTEMLTRLPACFVKNVVKRLIKYKLR